MKTFITTYISILICLVTNEITFAQDFAPLNSFGNTWVWEINDSTIFRTKLIDTNSFYNNGIYNKIQYIDTHDFFIYARYDNEDSLFYRFYGNHPYNNGDVPYYKFNCIVGDTFSFPINQFFRSTKKVIDVYQTLVFDTLLTVKIIHYSYGGLVEGIEIWTDELGMLYQDQSEGFSVTFRLRGCVINGKVYGDTSLTVGVDDELFTVHNFKLFQNYPNPFNPTTNIEYELEEYAFVNLKVYDLLGNEVAIIVNEKKYMGKYLIKFDAKGLSSGVYFYKLTVGGNTQVRKMILLR